MQIDEKLEQSYTADVNFEEDMQQQNEEYKVLESSFDAYSNGFQSKIDDPMNRSFYEGRDNDILANNANNGDLLNTVQPIPSFEDEQPEADHQHTQFNGESDKPEADLLGFEAQSVPEPSQEISQPPQEMIESSDNFEAERFVEEIKGASESKYVDTELSPTIPEAQSNFQSPPVVEETIVTHTSFKEDLSASNLDTMVIETSKTDILEPPTEVIESPADGEFKPTEFVDIPEIVEAVVQEPVVAKLEEPKIAAAAEKKSPAKSAETKKKEPVAAKKPLPAKAPIKVAEVKKTEVKPKPLAAKPSTVKPPVSKTSTVRSATSTTSTRPALSKPAPPTVPLMKKTTSTVTNARTITKSAPKPATSTSSTVPAKRPVTSAPAAR